MTRLRPLIKAIHDGLEPDKTWSDGKVTAWMFDYDTLDDLGALVDTRHLTPSEHEKVSNDPLLSPEDYIGPYGLK